MAVNERLMRENRFSTDSIRRIAEGGEIFGIDARNYLMDRGSVIFNATFSSRQVTDRANGRNRPFFWHIPGAMIAAGKESRRLARAAMGDPDWDAREKFDADLRAYAKRRLFAITFGS